MISINHSSSLLPDDTMTDDDISYAMEKPEHIIIDRKFDSLHSYTNFLDDSSMSVNQGNDIFIHHMIHIISKNILFIRKRRN
jgi:hypothetical protein